MQMIRHIVDREQLRQFDIPANYGRRVEVIIQPLTDRASNHFPDSLALTKLQEQGGFVQTELTAPAEDVWNGEHDRFVASCYDAVIKDDAEEDAVWSKYL